MNKEQAQEKAGRLLIDIIKSQPQLLTAASGAHLNQPKELANFCSEFIEQYAENLIKMGTK